MAQPTISLTDQVVRDGSTMLMLTTPYHPSFPRAARDIGGQWSDSAKAWFFDLRDVDRVRALCVSVYGVDPRADAPPELVTVRLDLEKFAINSSELFDLGRMLLSRYSRDSRVKLGDGVILVAGGFAAQGGSMKNPRVAPLKNTIIEVRDVPRPAAEAFAAQIPDALTYVDGATASTAPADPVPALLAAIAKLGAADRERLIAKLSGLVTVTTDGGIDA